MTRVTTGDAEGRDSIEKPSELAALLARRALRIKTLIVHTLGQADDQRACPLGDLHIYMCRSLTSLTTAQFADTFAQAITYIVFTARWVNRGLSEEYFSRAHIPNLLPSTRASLINLFEQLFRGGDDEGLTGLIDELIGFLVHAPLDRIFSRCDDPIIEFYQSFLEVYDPQIRRERGVYYTPDPLVSYVVSTTHHALQDELGLALGLADLTTWGEVADQHGLNVPDGLDLGSPFVQILDPAAGTGTFLIKVIDEIYHTHRSEYQRQGFREEEAQRRWCDDVREHVLPRIHGFELMITPYIVAHLRIGLALAETGFTFQQDDELRLYLTDTLEMYTSDGADDEEIECQAAEYVKREVPISVLIGNPPYDLDHSSTYPVNRGGWIRNGWQAWRSGRPPLDDFHHLNRHAGSGSLLISTYNQYVYFWRWALWSVFERYVPLGIIALITPSAFVRGPGFAGMRQYLRHQSQVWVLDLEGDQRGVRRTANVFGIQTPVAITTLVRGAGSPPRANYYRLEGGRTHKLEMCARYTRLTDIMWRACGPDHLLPLSSDQWTELPGTMELFTWKSSGVKAGRVWVVSETPTLAYHRWRLLITADKPARGRLFKESSSGATLMSRPRRLPPQTGKATPLSEVSISSDHGLDSVINVERFGYRSFDRQYIIADSRVLDRPRAKLWATRGPHQLYLNTFLSKPIGPGPAATISAFIVDNDHFRGSYGGDVIPLWRDAQGKVSNISPQVLRRLEDALMCSITPDDLFAYLYLTLATPRYTQRFREELQTPGQRVPITKDKTLFKRGVELGQCLICWHTFGARFRPDQGHFELSGAARLIRPILNTREGYPEEFEYDHARELLRIGDGVLGPVTGEMWRFSVSGLRVLRSWLKYRMRDRAGRKSSPLDEVRPIAWVPEMTRELLEMLWVLEWTLSRYPIYNTWFDEVITGEVFTAAELR